MKEIVDTLHSSQAGSLYSISAITALILLCANFKASAAGKENAYTQTSGRKFNKLDSDQDGKLSCAETAGDKSLAASFDELGMNTIGVLDAKEYGARKTHPIVLIATVASTVFSLLGSAVMTGLIPNAHSERQGTIEQSTVSNGDAAAASQAAPNISSNSINSYITPYKSKVQPHQVLPNSEAGKSVACNSCGKIISISAMGQKGNGYMIKIRMENGSYRTITQYSKPLYSVGDQVKLSSERLTIA